MQNKIKHASHFSAPPSSPSALCSLLPFPPSSLLAPPWNLPSLSHSSDLTYCWGVWNTFLYSWVFLPKADQPWHLHRGLCHLVALTAVILMPQHKLLSLHMTLPLLHNSWVVTQALNPSSSWLPQRVPSFAPWDASSELQKITIYKKWTRIVYWKYYNAIP